MINRILCFFVLFVVFFGQNAMACDVCGCTVSGQQFGILPQFNKHFVGIKYGYRTFTSMHPPLFSTDTASKSKESFSTFDVWGRFVIADRLQIFGFIPYQHITKVESGSGLVRSGFGDVSAIALYAVINQKKSAALPLYQNLQIGGGLKLPTGSNNFLTPDQEWIPGIQMGTASTDMLFNVSYLIRYNEIGASAECNARINGKNTGRDFKYGDRITSSIRIFYLKRLKENSILPSLGLMVENSQKDYHEGATVDLSGGTNVFGHLGLDFFSPSFTFGVQIQPAVFQHVAGGNLTSGTRIGAQFSVLF